LIAAGFCNRELILQAFYFICSLKKQDAMTEVVLVASFCSIPHASNKIDNHILPPLSRNKKGARLPLQGLFAPGG
jgi:hypothetical protein